MKRFARLISGALLLCMVFSMLAPLTLFAADSTTEDTSRYVLRETFTETVNTKSTEAALTASKGYYVSVPSGSSYSVENHELQWYRADRHSNYMRIYPSYFGNDELLTQDFIISFWIKPDVEITKNFSIIKLVGTGQDVQIPVSGIKSNEWSLVEMAFSNSASTTTNDIITTPCTVMLNGKTISNHDIGNVADITYYKLPTSVTIV